MPHHSTFSLPPSPPLIFSVPPNIFPFHLQMPSYLPSFLPPIFSLFKYFTSLLPLLSLSTPSSNTTLHSSYSPDWSPKELKVPGVNNINSSPEHPTCLKSEINKAIHTELTTWPASPQHHPLPFPSPHSPSPLPSAPPLLHPIVEVINPIFPWAIVRDGL